MSTLKTVNIQHPSASTSNIILNSDGSIQGAPSGNRNRIINGDFSVWQRGTSFTPSASSLMFTADRWSFYKDGTFTATISRQAFTPGAAPVSGYEGIYFLRYNCTASNNQFTVLQQSIEDVRTFAGQTVTVSFWAKADVSRSISFNLQQNYGSGGSGQADVASGSTTIGTTWQRYTFTGLSVPSLSGKTLGDNSKLNLAIYVGNGTGTFDIWGVQVESGSIATPYEQKTYAQELRDCQRYFQKIAQITATSNTATTVSAWANLAIEMRIAPTASATGPLNFQGDGSMNATQSAASVGTQYNTPFSIYLASIGNFSGLTASRTGSLGVPVNNSNYITLSAEL